MFAGCMPKFVHLVILVLLVWYSFGSLHVITQPSQRWTVIHIPKLHNFDQNFGCEQRRTGCPEPSVVGSCASIESAVDHVRRSGLIKAWRVPAWGHSAVPFRGAPGWCWLQLIGCGPSSCRLGALNCGWSWLDASRIGELSYWVGLATGLVAS